MSSKTRERALLLTAALTTAAILILTAETQLYDSNFVSLWEATALLAGDHPYRDFFEWGAPLAAYASAAMQLLVGYRLIGEFLLQWTFIVAGVVIACRLGLRLCDATFPLLVALGITAIVLPITPTYHYPKLFFLPLTVWLAWRYIEHPSVRRSAAFGLAAGIAFLFRHDFGLYAAWAFLCAFALARLAVPASQNLRWCARDIAACGLGCALLVIPWAIVVQSQEGLLEYARMRGTLFQYHQHGTFYSALLEINPFALAAAWASSASDPRTATHHSALALQQITMLVPFLLLASAGGMVHRAGYRVAAVPLDAWLLAAAGLYLVVVELFLLRDPPYLVTVAPLTAALGARFLAARRAAVRLVAAAVAALSVVAAVMWTRELPIYRPAELADSMSEAIEKLFASPPAAAVSPLDGNPALSLQYLHDCTASGDRVLVTGSTPFQVPYYARRAVAGGHVYWHHGWRADPVHEQRLLDLLQQQSVPFAFSTTDPVIDDFVRYPRIRAYLEAHYEEVDGSGGRLLIDRRREATATYGSQQFPCFADGGRRG